MDEFLRTDGAELRTSAAVMPGHSKDPESSHNDSGEFPDLLDSESNLSMDYSKFGAPVNKFQPPHHTGGQQIELQVPMLLTIPIRF